MTEFKRTRLPARLVFPGRHRRPWDRLREEALRLETPLIASVAHVGSRETFEILPGLDSEARVLDSDARLRHLVLLAESGAARERYLFGHDERHLFVVRLPDRVTRVRDALRSLAPEPVLRAWTAGLRVRRQGEWFFVPEPGFVPQRDAVIRVKSPLSLRGHPHVVDEQFLEQRWISAERQWRSLLHARGAVRHADHATLTLREWHCAYRNREESLHGASPTFGYAD